MIKKVITISFFSFLFFLFFDLSSAPKITETELVQQLIEKWADNENEKETDFLINAQNVLEEAINLCNDLKAQIDWWSKIWLKIKRKPLYANEIFKLLEQVEEVKNKLAGLIQNSSEKKDLFVLEGKLKKIGKIVSLYKKLKQKAKNESKLEYLKAVFKSWLGYGGKYIVKKLGDGADGVLNIGTTIMLGMALVGVFNGIYFSESFISGFVVPFAWLGSFMWSFFQKATSEQIAQAINESWFRYIVYHVNIKSANTLRWLMSWFSGSAFEVAMVV